MKQTDIKARNRRIVSLYRSGRSTGQIGRQFGLSGERVRQILIKSDMDRRSSAITDANYKRAVDLVSIGMPIQHIADEIGCVRGTLRNRLVRDGHYSFRFSQQAWTADEEQFVLRTYRMSLSAAQIAKKLGRSRNEIIGKARRLGLSLSKPMEAAA